jgi:TonB family protein
MGSSLVHALLLICAAFLTTMHVDTAVEAPRLDERPRMVFLVTPGPAGGGGGGGARTPRPAAKLERRGSQRSRVSVLEVTPKPLEPKPAPEPEPVPARVLVAPVVAAAAEPQDRAGVVTGGRENTDSRGPGEGGGAGTGRGNGSGEGQGAGIGPGSGGGTGGGPYRPGSGITPPRLLREVKAEYTEEARRRNLTGEVLLEIVVRHDGTVGDVRIARGLGAGLDQRAADAVTQWRFEPARRLGTPVDVLVEVAVEFTLR